MGDTRGCGRRRTAKGTPFLDATPPRPKKQGIKRCSQKTSARGALPGALRPASIELREGAHAPCRVGARKNCRERRRLGVARRPLLRPLLLSPRFGETVRVPVPCQSCCPFEQVRSGCEERRRKRAIVTRARSHRTVERRRIKTKQ